MSKNNIVGDVAGSAGSAFDIVALAASAGGVQALSCLLSGLPEGFPVAIVVVQHLAPDYPSRMAEILERYTPMLVKQAEDGDILQRAMVYIAPPDRHLLVNGDGSLSLSHSELVHFVRPSADLLFESVAASFQERTIAVVLTGTGSDGDMGVQAVKSVGGVVVVQDPETAAFAGMPRTAIETGCADFVLPLEEIAAKLRDLVTMRPG